MNLKKYKVNFEFLINNNIRYISFENFLTIHEYDNNDILQAYYDGFPYVEKSRLFGIILNINPEDIITNISLPYSINLIPQLIVSVKEHNIYMTQIEKAFQRLEQIISNIDKFRTKEYFFEVESYYDN